MTLMNHLLLQEVMIQRGFGLRKIEGLQQLLECAGSSGVMWDCGTALRLIQGKSAQMT